MTKKVVNPTRYQNHPLRKHHALRYGTQQNVQKNKMVRTKSLAECFFPCLSSSSRTAKAKQKASSNALRAVPHPACAACDSELRKRVGNQVLRPVDAKSHREPHQCSGPAEEGNSARQTSISWHGDDVDSGTNKHIETRVPEKFQGRNIRDMIFGGVIRA